VRIKFVQSGGFGGLLKGCEVDAAVLGETERAGLQVLLDEGARRERSPGSRDLTTYDITVETGDQTLTLSFDDLTMPPLARSLLQALVARAKPLRP